MTISAIVAVDRNLAIGKGGGMPWHISEDLKYFKRVTGGHSVIMGRNTFASLGRPLPQRRNIVLTSRPLEYDAPLKEGTSLQCCRSLEEALELCKAEEEVFVIGGARLYDSALESIDRLYITLIDTEVEGPDAFFPDYRRLDWREISRSARQTDEGSGLEFESVVLERSAGRG